jgi:glycosyl-4,4'-diaponeurosporenoate acyltransferase
MFIELTPWAIALLNIIAIPVAHLAIAWWSTRLSSSHFRPSSFLFRSRKWERQGEGYQRLFRVRAWKDSLPDGAAWLSGFAKGSLRSRDPEYLRQFRVETCRGEFSHWLQMIVISVFVVWNPFPANFVIWGYAFLSNAPCIISQRHTRARLSRFLDRTNQVIE